MSWRALCCMRSSAERRSKSCCEVLFRVSMCILMCILYYEFKRRSGLEFKAWLKLRGKASKWKRGRTINIDKIIVFMVHFIMFFYNLILVLSCAVYFSNYFCNFVLAVLMKMLWLLKFLHYLFLFCSFAKGEKNFRNCCRLWLWCQFVCLIQFRLHWILRVFLYKDWLCAVSVMTMMQQSARLKFNQEYN